MNLWPNLWPFAAGAVGGLSSLLVPKRDGYSTRFAVLFAMSIGAIAWAACTSLAGCARRDEQPFTRSLTVVRADGTQTTWITDGSSRFRDTRIDCHGYTDGGEAWVRIDGHDVCAEVERGNGR